MGGTSADGIGETSAPQTEAGGSMQIAVSSSAQNKLVGFGGAIQKQPAKYRNTKLKTFPRHTWRNSGAESILRRAGSNGACVADVAGTETIQNHATNEQQNGRTHNEYPRQQSGQEHVCLIYKLIRQLRRNGNRITIRWVPTGENDKLLGLAKGRTRAATHEDSTPFTQLPRTKSTTLNIAQSQQSTSQGSPEKVGVDPPQSAPNATLVLIT